MAFDGLTVANIARDLSDQLTGGRVYKIAQTESDELLLTIKQAAEKGKQKRLYMSADPSLPLIYLSDINKNSPMTAPGFCMLLRKHIQNGIIVSVSQPGLERVVRIDIEHLDEMGDMKSKTLLIELMGKYSNIIFTDENDTIIDSIKHISASVSSVREVLPGRKYFIPMTQNKLNPLDTNEEEFCNMLSSKRSSPVYKAIYGSYTGFSSVISQEICYRAGIDSGLPMSVVTNAQAKDLFKHFEAVTAQIKTGSFEPNIIYENGKPLEYAAISLSMYSSMDGCEVKKATDISALLESYYSEKNTITRIRQKSSDLRRIVSTCLERTVRKYDLQLNQMKDTKKKDKYRTYGELLNVYGYNIPEGSKSVKLNDYNTGEDITIPLDPTITPIQNAKKYFDRYGKLKRTYEALLDLTKEVKAEIDHLESISTSLDIARKEDDLLEINEELIASGYIHKKRSNSKKQKVLSKPFHYVSENGFDIYVGKNNYQNDELTFKVANGGDWWFHAKQKPGSHVVLKTDGKEVPDKDFEQAASLAAYYSKGREQTKVEIDYLQRKNVKKPGGAKPGFVVYYTNYSMTVSPDISKIKELL